MKGEEKEKLYFSEDSIKWEFLTNKMLKNGFLKSCILDLKDGEIVSGTLQLNYNEFQGIVNILNGANSIGFNVEGHRYFVVSSDNLLIRGSSFDLSCAILRISSKCIVGVFKASLIEIDVLDIIQNISDNIIHLNKNEFISNQVEE